MLIVNTISFVSDDTLETKLERSLLEMTPCDGQYAVIETKTFRAVTHVCGCVNLNVPRGLSGSCHPSLTNELGNGEDRVE